MRNLPAEKAILYVASGTGNTLYLANTIARQFSATLAEVSVVMIDEADNCCSEQHGSDTLVGFLFPTHGFLPPWSMLKFLMKIGGQKKSVAAFCLATRGGIRIGSVTVPGIAGLATFVAALLLLFKGYRPRALFSLDMPSNFMNFHWGLHPVNVKFITERTLKRLRATTERLIKGNRILFTKNNLWELFWGLGLLWLIPLFPLYYLLVGKLFMAKMMFAGTNCVGCGICSRLCPNNAIEMRSAKGRKKPFWTYHCEVCLRCMGYCPQRAVEAGHSWGILLYYASSVPIISYALYRLSLSLSLNIAIGGPLYNAVFYIVDCIVAILLAYIIFWQLNRISWVDVFFTRTSLTHYFRRYHYPEYSLKNFIAKK